jgi:hypothetical protein
MGEVIHVKFGVEKNWADIEKSITNSISKTLAQFMPERLDRAAWLAGETVREMRSLDNFLTLSCPYQRTFPDTEAGRFAEVAVRDALAAYANSVEQMVVKLRDAAHLSICLAATTAVTGIVASGPLTPVSGS